MDPHGSTSKPDQPSTPQFNIESFSGYGSTASSLPGSGAVTPRTTVFVDPHYDERAPLLPDPHGDPAEAEAGSSGSKGEFSKRICVWDRFTISVGYVRSSSPTHCTFVAPVPSKHKQLYARSCCQKIYQTLGPRFFMRHSGPPPFKEGYRYFGMVPRSGCSRQIRFWHIVPARPQVSHFVRELRAIGCLVASV